jgi:hypothetical protein
VKCFPNKNNCPPKEALKRVREYVSREGLKKQDEAWVVVDKDSWPEEHLIELNAWAQTRSNFGFALSNPKFEYWLLLHFEEADSVMTSTDCDRRIPRHLPGYDKHIDPQHFPIERIRTAVARAKRQDYPPCADWPRKPGTTVYKLVERILESGER